MSAHDRRIRHAVKAGLKCAKTAAGDRVYSNRIAAFSEDMLPALNVWTADSEVTESASGPLEYKRAPNLKIEIVVRANPAPDDDADDRADEIAEQVETWIATHELLADELGNTSAKTRLVRTESDVRDGSEHPLASQVLTYTVEYYQEAPTGDAQTFPPLAKVGVRWSPGATGATSAVDELDIPLK